MFKLFNCCRQKTGEKQQLLSPGDNTSVQISVGKGKGKAPLQEDNPNKDPQVVIEMPQTRENEKQNVVDTTRRNAQIINYCGYSLIGTGFAATILLLGAAGVSARSESRHPNIEHIASLISYFLSGFGITAFLSGGLILDYANKQLKRLTSQEAHSSTEEAKAQEHQQQVLPYEASTAGKGCGLY